MPEAVLCYTTLARRNCALPGRRLLYPVLLEYRIGCFEFFGKAL